MKYNSVVDYLRERDKVRTGNQIATEYNGNLITRKKYWEIVDKYKKYFLSQGFFYGCQKPVTICKYNVPEYEFMYMALLELGAIVSTVSSSFFKSDPNMHSVEKGSDTIVLSAELIDQDLKQALENLDFTKIKRIIFTSCGSFSNEIVEAEYNAKLDFKSKIDYLDIPKNVEIVYPGEIKESNTKIVIPTYNNNDFRELSATYSNTGGTTTGIPNCAVHTHQAIVNLLKAHEKEIFPEFPVTEKDRALLLIPISHITSQFYALLLRRASGATIVYNPKAFDPKEITNVLIEDEISDVIAPFGLYIVIANSPLKPGDLKTLNPGCGGEPTPYNPTKQVNERLAYAGASRLVIGGGSTEFGSAFMSTYGVEDRCNETGILIPGAEAKIINPKTQKEAKEGERGILYARCDWQMKEYLNNEKETKEFFNYTDDEGKVWGTNNDIGAIKRYYNDKPVYSMDGRVHSFVKKDEQTNKYYSGITFTDGKVDPVDLTEGKYLFDMRDMILNIPGVLEAEALIIPFDKNTEQGTPVVNIVVAPQVDLVKVIKEIYTSYQGEEFLPKGVIFRTNFARSLATDKRSVLPLKEERNNYYALDKNDNIVKITLPEGKEPISEIVDNLNVIQKIKPPAPQKILVKK